MQNRRSIRRKFNHGGKPWHGPRPQNGQSRSNQPRRAQPSQNIHPDKYVNQATVSQVQDAPYMPHHQFADFNLDPIILQNIRQKGYTEPTPIQDQAIGEALMGKDIVGIANTGTGKTAAFLLPLIQSYFHDRRTRVLIMCPTRELAAQIDDELKAFTRGTDVSAALCIGGASMHNQIGQLRRHPVIIIATPGRLKDLIQQNQINMQQFSHVVLDEVDRMVDIGFLKDIQRILAMLPQRHQSLFFSATVTSEVAVIIQQFLHNPVTVSVKTHDTAQTIDQDVIKVSDPEKKFEILVELFDQAGFEKVIIFVRTKRGAERLNRKLVQRGFRTSAIHGDKSQGQRQRALDQFKADQLQILVATDVAARGLDIPDVSHVINYDEPATYEDYVHRIGRTGRANKAGKALTFVG